MKLSIRAKVMGTLALIVGAMAILGWVSLDALGALADDVREVREGVFARVQVIEEANTDLAKWQRAVLTHILAEDAEERRSAEERVARRFARVKAALAGLLEGGGLSAQGAELLREVQADLERLTPVAERVLALSREEHDAQARAARSTELKPLAARVDDAMDRFAELQRSELDKAATRSREASERTSGIVLSVLGAAILGSVLVGTLLTSGISAGLGAAVSLARSVAEGRVDVEVRGTGRGDEIGTLMQAMGRVVESSRGLAQAAEQVAAGNLEGRVAPRSDHDVLSNALAGMARNLRSQIGEIVEAANVLASAGAEIMASTTQLAASTSETASAVTQTATTMQEVRQTAQVANDKARQIAEGTQEVIELGERGVQSTGETTDAMHRIREQMEAISESVLALSEQGQSIADIISSVEDLAEQSNVLAVNAAIEAARAGEEGKGFGVVASEIRSLAEQSKKATGQIRAILGDIRKATAAAVMTAEQGSKAVASGAEQSVRTGESIARLVEGARQAVGSTRQIAASSQEQLAGIDQVATAMDSIRQASGQNAASTRQAEEAARSLADVGERLKALVGRYRI